jgi:hypothetical protein
MYRLLLLGLSVLFAAPFWFCFWRFGWPAWIAYGVPAGFAFGFWMWAMGTYERENKDMLFSAEENRRFCVEISLVFLSVLLSGVGTYLVSAHLITKESALVRSIVKGNPDIEAVLETGMALQRGSRPNTLWSFPPEKPGLLGYVRYLLAFLAMLISWLVTSAILFPSSSEEEEEAEDDGNHVRGRRLISYAKACRISRRLVENDHCPLFFGGLWLPFWAAVFNFLFIGKIGTGKSMLFRLLMQSVLPRIQPGSDCRAMIDDFKGDTLPQLYGMELSCPVKTFHPFIQGGVAWAIAQDCTSPATALQIATILIPVVDGDKQPFFSDAARHLLFGVLIALMQRAPKNFTFRDVVLAVQSEKALRELLSSTEVTRNLVERYLEAREFSSILSTIATKMAPFEIIAAAWSRAKESVSLRDWLSGSYILVLGSDESTRAAMEAVNQMIFRVAVTLLLSMPDSKTRRVWFFKDEARAAKWDGLSALLTTGRSKGGCTALGIQDIEGFRHIMTDKIANEILGQCSNIAILALSSEATARWASETMGAFERHEYHQSTTKGFQSSSTTTSEQLVKREAVLPSEFMTLPATNPENGLTGFFLCPDIGAYRAVLSGEFLTASLLPPNEAVPGNLPRPEEDQYLEPWTAEDLRRLKLGIDPDLPPSAMGPPSTPPGAPPRSGGPSAGKLKILKPDSDK